MSLPSSTESPTTTRLQSLDAYRGAIMISLAFGGFGLAETAQRFIEANGESSIWSAIHYQFDHVQWTGCGYWDMIQPSFMFMVGVSMAFSYVKREDLGHSYLRMFSHALVRSVVLVLLGVFLSSNGSPSTNWSFMNVLSQIGLGYALLFLLWRRGSIVQLSAVVLLLVGTWLLYVQNAGPGIDIKIGNEALGITADWAQENLSDIAPAWHKNANVGNAIDVRVLNWFPRAQSFEYNSGGYQTINFIPSLATMILGLICGEWLRSMATESRKFWSIVALGIICLGVGWGLAELNYVPLIKRIWTPSWALFSTGCCCFILAALFGVIDVLNFRAWSFPLVVVGTNSMAVYLMSQLLKPWVGKTLKTHFGANLFLMFGEQWEPVVSSCLIGLMFWLVCLWLYKQRAFLRI